MKALMMTVPVLALALCYSTPTKAVEDTDWAVDFANRAILMEALEIEVEEMRDLVVLFEGRGFVYDEDLAAGTDQNLLRGNSCTEVVGTGTTALGPVTEANFAAAKQTLKTNYESCWDTLDLLDDELGSVVLGDLETALEGGFASKAAVSTHLGTFLNEMIGELADIKTVVAMQTAEVQLIMESHLTEITNAISLLKTTAAKVPAATQAQWEELEIEIDDSLESADISLVEAYRSLLSEDDEDEDEDEDEDA